MRLFLRRITLAKMPSVRSASSRAKLIQSSRTPFGAKSATTAGWTRKGISSDKASVSSGVILF
jgi:hypothetical protein